MAARIRWGSGLIDVVPVSASFTLGDANNEQLVQSSAAADITITLPNNLPVGFSCLLEQGGAGAVILSAATGASLLSRQDFDRTAGQYALCTLYVRSNTNGRNAEYVLGGDAGAAA